MTNEANLQGTVSAPKAKKRKVASLDRKKARAGWVFVLPFVIGFAFVYLPIIWNSIWMSFHELKIITGGGYELIWAGLDNYQWALFEDPSFVQTLIAGLGELAFDIPAILIFSLFMAVLLNQKMVGRAAFRAIFFIPVILATGIMESIEGQNILGTMMESGINDGSGGSASTEIVSAMDISRLFSSMKIGTELVTYVVDMINNIYDIVNRSGVQMLIFLAGLQSISPAIYEACRIDGATAWETFWKITFPMISPMILVNGVYTIIDSFTTDSNSVMSYINSVYQATDGQVRSSAMAWMYFMIVVLIILAVVGIFSAFVFYQKRDA
ncbi:MAG: sugar ABC transporter permease [Ruminococcaceae bacterium]|nr:sugar ABC transporter permease [Oscillospiraceae bacterium]